MLQQQQDKMGVLESVRTGVVIYLMRAVSSQKYYRQDYVTSKNLHQLRREGAVIPNAMDLISLPFTQLSPLSVVATHRSAPTRAKSAVEFVFSGVANREETSVEEKRRVEARECDDEVNRAASSGRQTREKANIEGNRQEKKKQRERNA
ncbi:hypothetical protein ACTXT7_004776 [Hymenolepis weldensis]